jgi:hypothetical protein
MKLSIGLHLEVEGDDHESEQVEKLRQQIEDNHLGGDFCSVSVDESLLQDFFGILRDLKQLESRSRARRRD